MTQSILHVRELNARVYANAIEMNGRARELITKFDEDMARFRENTEDLDESVITKLEEAETCQTEFNVARSSCRSSLLLGVPLHTTFASVSESALAIHLESMQKDTRREAVTRNPKPSQPRKRTLVQFTSSIIN